MTNIPGSLGPWMVVCLLLLNVQPGRCGGEETESLGDLCKTITACFEPPALHYDLAAKEAPTAKHSRLAASYYCKAQSCARQARFAACIAYSQLAYHVEARPLFYLSTGMCHKNLNQIDAALALLSEYWQMNDPTATTAGRARVHNDIKQLRERVWLRNGLILGGLVVATGLAVGLEFSLGRPHAAIIELRP